MKENHVCMCGTCSQGFDLQCKFLELAIDLMKALEIEIENSGDNCPNEKCGHNFV